MSKIISIFVFTIFLITLCYFSYNSYNASLKYEQSYINYANTKTLENTIQNGTNDLINNLFSTLLGIKAKNKEINNDMLVINKYENIVYENFKYFIIILFISFLTYFILSKTIFLLYLHIVSIGTLFLGFYSPIFLMYITKNIANTNVILQFESSTILSSIEKLYIQDNYFVGSIILIFSILFPIIKTIISFFALIYKNTKKINFISNLLSKISKFSMTDVFVLSIFLVYLSPKPNGMIKTQLEIGFYFFFIYVILSLIIGLLISKNKNN